MNNSNLAQPGILAEVPAVAQYLTFDLKSGSDARASLQALAAEPATSGRVVGLGTSLIQALGADIPGLRPHPVHCGAGFSVPSTPAALWFWLRNADRGELVLAARSLRRLLAGAFEVRETIDAFRHGSGRDLSGYEDGTENPTGEDAIAAGIVNSNRPGLAGSSFVAVQRWVHDLTVFETRSRSERDLIIGRRISDNTEIEDAPESAHVKRTAQESFEPEAFLVRRSMPWSDATCHGLVFVAFGRSLDAYEMQLRRMVGLDDGIVDALFRFTRPITGACYWCPPVIDDRLDLSALDL